MSRVGHPKGVPLTAAHKRAISQARLRLFRKPHYRTALMLVNKYHPEVTHVKDARRGIDIEVTKADRKAGRSKNPNACALANACKRSFDGAIIAMKVVYLIKGKKATRYATPERVSREIVSFDRGHDFAPGVYYLRPPAPTQLLGHRHHGETGPHNTKLGPPRHIHKTTGVRAL